MNTAKEKAQELWTVGVGNYEMYLPLATKIIEQDRLDAMKEGARRAAVRMINESWTGEQCKNAILNASKRWTKKDL